ncbi:hypothetical protein GO755_03340 [Spirosoma sp. HMF4905]|uniref:Uncharacterized protein n=1 Tax=Spirosoma arboris TaxID=2682092 RepID=A0A7K1S5F5_9BACT|nr:hypothetical protein [Spirosoma arboris]MVM29052.1 hypothetical protein [Spirosoma arboris]
MDFFRGSQWQQLPFSASDLGITNTGDVYLLGEEPGDYGQCLYKLDQQGLPQRVSQDSNVSGVALNTNGLYASLISPDGRLNQYNLYTQNFTPGATYALEAGYGGDGSFYWLGSDTYTADNRLYKLTLGDYGEYTQALPGHGARLAVDSHGNPWIVTRSLDIYRFRSDTPMTILGKARDISASSNYTVCIISIDFRIYGASYTYQTTDPWVGIPDIINTPVRVAISPEGVPWYIDQFNNVYKRV